MQAHTPQGQGDGGSGPGSRRSSAGASRCQASSGSGLPRPLQTSLRESRINSIRAANNTQPQYNLFTGEMSQQTTGRPPSRQNPAGLATGATAMAAPPSHYANSMASRESSKENQAPPDAEEYETQRRRIEELKAELGTLRYTLSSGEQERELAIVAKDNEVRDARRRAEEDFAARQAAEAEAARVRRLAESLQSELDEGRGEREAQCAALERRAREAEAEARLLNEQLEDLSAARDEAARRADRRVADLQGQVAQVQRAGEELTQEGAEREAAFQEVQAGLVARDQMIGELEAEVLRLKAHTGDAETMAIIKRELSEQVQHIRFLEATNREQLVELKHLRQSHKAVEVVEEEKRSLQIRLDANEMLERHLAEERMQRQRLEDERRAWAAYLQSGPGEEDMEFDSPQAMARALIEERMNLARLTDQLGLVQPEVAAREEIIKGLEDTINMLQLENEKLKSAGGITSSTGAGGAGAEASLANNRVFRRLERQIKLLSSDNEHLRAQLKTFDAEDMTFQPENFDQKKADQIQQLENMLDKYKKEIQTLHAELSSLESSASSPVAPAAVAGTKRAFPSSLSSSSGAAGAPDNDAAHEQLGQLARKNRKLQDELSAFQSRYELLHRELAVSREQLAAAKTASSTRILALRDNPTSQFEAVKTATLTALRTENTELLAHVQRAHAANPASYPTIPMSVLAAAQREIAEAQAATVSAEKSSRRLKEVWAAKSAEFREAVFSTLGWHVSFLPNGRMRVESVFHPSATDEHENSIVFDGERGTMKVGGGPRSAFAGRIADNIRFWVREKGCIPGFLAALTLEFYEEHTRVAKPS